MRFFFFCDFPCASRRLKGPLACRFCCPQKLVALEWTFRARRLSGSFSGFSSAVWISHPRMPLVYSLLSTNIVGSTSFCEVLRLRPPSTFLPLRPLEFEFLRSSFSEPIQPTRSSAGFSYLSHRAVDIPYPQGLAY